MDTAQSHDFDLRHLYFATFLFIGFCINASAHGAIGPYGGGLYFWTGPNSTVNARVTYPDGNPVGPEFFAQLLAGPEGTSLSTLLPVFPSTTFFDTPLRLGYVRPADVMVENVIAGENATVVMRAFNGQTWENSTYRGQSDPIIVPTGNATRPAGFLEGLQSFNVYPVTEPSSIAFVFLGIALFAFNAKLRSTK